MSLRDIIEKGIHKINQDELQIRSVKKDGVILFHNQLLASEK